MLMAASTAPQNLIHRIEQRLLPLVAKGLTNKEIGRALDVSPRTVETHRANMRRKLLLKSGAQLLRYAVAWSHAEDHGQTQRTMFARL